ncbi:glycosyltransferase [Pontibacter vulgaris]|uniref:glycosyltransferase n=1 Tax=Pontibacter vulgaris TaxID=2905679 RepID=UPI001FA722D7|nr:glycosyltransferase [Pontibacter vulgaris]
MEKGVTIVVCTYNGAHLLPDTIRHIAQQRVRSTIPWEVIVVDNASTDNTSEVVQREWGKYNSDTAFSLLYQPTQGLTYARELALARARYEYVLFCDDDNWLNQDYVSIVFDLMIQHPRIGVLGGHGELVYEKLPPDWASAFTMFGNGPQETSSGKVKRNIVYGAGCVLRKSAFLKILDAGYKPLLTGRVGQNLSSGEDYELCYAIALANYDIWYDARLRFKHYMPKERIEWKYYERFFTEGIQCVEVLIPYSIILNYGVKSSSQFYLKLFRLFLSNIKQLYLLLLNKFKHPINSTEAKINTLMLKKVSARLWTFRKHRVMKNNFVKILSLNQNKMRDYAEKEANLIPYEYLN